VPHASIIFEDQFSVPLGIATLASFRAWALSDEFPESGRIDYIDGDIEVDMSPEDFFTHGTLKMRLGTTLQERVDELDLGHVVSDASRVSSPEARLSAEPDIVVVTHAALDEGRVRLVPKSSGEEGRYIEIEGGPDLVVEIVSDSSVRKDTTRLPGCYFAAGVREYWLADARGEIMVFQIQQRGDSTFEPVPVDADGFQASQVLHCAYDLERKRHQRGHWAYTLRARPQ
jgi:Uma2 family endonuclease